MILRIQVNGQQWSYDKKFRIWVRPKTRLMGVGRAGFGYLMMQLPVPAITNRRTRFYFTERGWHAFGRHIYWEARRQGHTVQVLRRNRPPASQIVYEDEHQLAVLPDNRREAGDSR